jgi:hypothetical protein
MLFGTLGTSREKIQEMLRCYGYKSAKGKGESELRKRLKIGPAVVCLDAGATGDAWFGLHWVAVFGYVDKNQYHDATYYITNWVGYGGELSRAKFNKGWNTYLTSSVSWSSHEFYYPYK